MRRDIRPGDLVIIEKGGDVIPKVGDLLHHRPDEISGGQRQRVAIARALVVKPQVVFADEPTANLDSINGRAVLDLMRRLNREEKTTFILASHDQAVMAEADRMVRIVDGTVQHA